MRQVHDIYEKLAGQPCWNDDSVNSPHQVQQLRKATLQFCKHRSAKVAIPPNTREELLAGQHKKGSPCEQLFFITIRQIKFCYLPPPPSSNSIMNPRSGKRRGRPRSPIFSYYRRITDDKGVFIGNECHFCTFVSRDRSENPTYLTRHILRSCTAPQHIKDAMSVRNSSNLQTTPQFNPKAVKPESPIDTPLQPPIQPPSPPTHPQQLQQVSPSTPPQPPPHPPTPPPLPPQPSTLTTQPTAIPLRTDTPVSKSRRGRPRSPALQHFRRHTDEKGIFLANKCIHCHFVSRDRSENSTLLLRHLLSTACEAPEEVRITLRAAKRTNKARRKAIRAKKDDDTGLDLPLMRFCLAHGLNLSAVESPYMRDLVEAIRGHASGVNCDNVTVIKTEALPDLADLDAVLKQISLSDLVKNDSKITYSGSTQLVIYFPHIPQSRRHKLLTNCDPANGVGRQTSPSYIASAFLVGAGRHLRYLYSKNCQTDFEGGVAEIVQDALRDTTVKIDQIMIGRPLVDIDKPRGIPKACAEQDWIVDVAREIEIISQELLSQVPLFVRCQRRNKILANFFREDYSERTALMFFGRSMAEKERYQSYLAHIATLPEMPSCCHIVQNAVQTYEILRQSQGSHDDPQRMGEVGTFAQALTEENSGNRQICQEVIRLLLSTQFRKDLKAFLSIMTPFSSLILRYGNGEPADEPKGKDILEEPIRTTSRSISHVLPDCLRTLCELYALKLPEYDSDVRLVRDHAACRLIKGTEGFPAVAGDICYIAACLDPGAVLSSMQGMAAGDVWKRVLKFLESHGGQGDGTMDRVVEQLQSFQQRAGVFSVPEMFHESGEPRAWWSRHGSVAPELADIAVNILSVPTTTFPAIRQISESNSRDEDLRGTERDSLMQKRRSAIWNLRLSMKR